MFEIIQKNIDWFLELKSTRADPYMMVLSLNSFIRLDSYNTFEACAWVAIENF